MLRGKNIGMIPGNRYFLGLSPGPFLELDSGGNDGRVGRDERLAVVSITMFFSVPFSTPLVGPQPTRVIKGSANKQRTVVLADMVSSKKKGNETRSLYRS